MADHPQAARLSELAKHASLALSLGSSGMDGLWAWEMAHAVLEVIEIAEASVVQALAESFPIGWCHVRAVHEPHVYSYMGGEFWCRGSGKRGSGGDGR